MNSDDGIFEADFIEDRRLGLEEFINNIAGIANSIKTFWANFRPNYCISDIVTGTYNRNKIR